MAFDKKFAHLHLHTQYSLLDGAIKIPQLMRKTADYGLPAVAMTDHGNLFGAVELVKESEKMGVRGIVGCETYVAPESRRDRKIIEGFEKAYHLVLLVQDEEGYKNLCKLVSLANIEGFYYRPRVDKEILRKYNKGLIALSACLAGEVPSLIGKDRIAEARERMLEYADIFDDGRYYLEVQKNGIPVQDKVNTQLAAFAKESGIKMVATGDCHYLNKEDAKAHEVLLCIQTGATLTDPKRYKFDTEELYYKTAEEMYKEFEDFPGACESTIEIAERCDFHFQSKHHFPVYRAPEGESLMDDAALDAEMERQARAGYVDRLAFMKANYKHWTPDLEKVYDDRLEEELKLIKSMHFASYFLIVSDFIVWAKKNGIPVGPGRGSAAGSLVAFSMSITDIDPIRYNLLFERFLNPERVSMPDIDVDFCQDRRGEVIKYVTEKYGGSAYVTQIITFGQMKAKLVIRDVGRAMGIPLKEVDKLAKMIPLDPKMTLEKAMEMDSRFEELMKKDAQIRQLLTYAKSLEGLSRQAGVHAAGVVIADRPMDEYLPLFKSSKGEITTSFEMKSVEKVGLIKFDFLGLKTLSIIKYALDLIRKNYDISLDLATIDMTDKKTFELLQSGRAACVFQLESGGMRDLLRKIRPNTFEDIIAILALYRPGPLEGGMVDDFINRKHGKTQVVYTLPALEPILRETYGVIVYQEQVMQISRALAGYSLGQADLLRRAMGKKDANEMAKEKGKFLEGAHNNKVDPKKAEEIFDLMAKFAEYGFNKSHSAAYALVSFHTAYLKAHYPKEFMAAVLSYEVNNTDKIVAYTTECRDMGIHVFPPHVDSSLLKFTTEGNGIRFGMAAIRGVGEGAIDTIIEARGEEGEFKDIFDLCSRIDTRKVNRKALEALVKAGAFDGAKKTDPHRAQVFTAIDAALEQSSRTRKDVEVGQFSMFGALAESKPDLKPLFADVPAWKEAELLTNEKESLGMYMSSHPLNKYKAVLARYATANTLTAKDMPTKKEVRIGVVMRSVKEKISQRGGRWGIVTFEDMHGSIDTFVFSDLYQPNSDVINSDTPLFVIGELDRDEGSDFGGGGGDEDHDRIQEARVKLIVKEICPLDEVERRYANSVHVQVQADEVSEQLLMHLKNAFKRNTGTKKTVLHIVIPHRSETVIELPSDYAVNPSDGFFKEMHDLFGRNAALLQ